MEKELKLLVVDDDEHLRKMIVNTIGNLGFNTVEQASNGHEAVMLATKNRYDLIIMDINMPPGIDGVEAASLITKDNKAHNIVGFSGIIDDSIRKRCTNAGMQDVFEKPRQINALKLFIKDKIILDC